MIANIALDDGLILPHSANPTGSNFRERQGGIYHYSLSTNWPVPHSYIKEKPPVGGGMKHTEHCGCGSQRADTAFEADRMSGVFVDVKSGRGVDDVLSSTRHWTQTMRIPCA